MLGVRKSPYPAIYGDVRACLDSLPRRMRLTSDHLFSFLFLSFLSLFIPTNQMHAAGQFRDKVGDMVTCIQKWGLETDICTNTDRTRLWMFEGPNLPIMIVGVLMSTIHIRRLVVWARMNLHAEARQWGCASYAVAQGPQNWGVRASLAASKGNLVPM